MVVDGSSRSSDSARNARIDRIGKMERVTLPFHSATALEAAVAKNVRIRCVIPSEPNALPIKTDRIVRVYGGDGYIGWSATVLISDDVIIRVIDKFEPEKVIKRRLIFLEGEINEQGKKVGDRKSRQREDNLSLLREMQKQFSKK